jgi:hypothetical protein
MSLWERGFFKSESNHPLPKDEGGVASRLKERLITAFEKFMAPEGVPNPTSDYTTAAGYDTIDCGSKDDATTDPHDLCGPLSKCQLVQGAEAIQTANPCNSPGTSTSTTTGSELASDVERAALMTPNTKLDSPAPESNGEWAFTERALPVDDGGWVFAEDEGPSNGKPGRNRAAQHHGSVVPQRAPFTGTYTIDQQLNAPIKVGL